MILSPIEKALDDIHQTIKAIPRTDLDEQVKRECRIWLNARERSEDEYQQNLRKRYEGTGTWIFETDQYKDWFAGKGTKCLWISGKPGI